MEQIDASITQTELLAFFIILAIGTLIGILSQKRQW